MPYLSAVVTAYNSENTLSRCLEALRQSTFHDYELIVVNDGSEDQTHSIARKYADKVINQPKNLGMSYARNLGVQASRGEIILNIDADIVVEPDILERVVDYFVKHPDIDALTGLLSKNHPHKNFFSQYKNLYMHYIFRKLSERVTFLYGSIHALRRSVLDEYDTGIPIANDTELGQRLWTKGRQIAFLPDLEVIHLKRHGWLSFFRNDFQVPFDWAKIFLKYRGWTQLSKNKTGFAHSPKEQLMSVVLAPLTLLCGLALPLFSHGFLFSVLVLLWFLINYRFSQFLIRERGLVFGIKGLLVTFMDQNVMAAGIVSGLITAGYAIRKERAGGH